MKHASGVNADFDCTTKVVETRPESLVVLTAGDIVVTVGGLFATCGYDVVGRCPGPTVLPIEEQHPMKSIRPGTATVGVLTVFLALSTVFFVGRRFGEAPVSPEDSIGGIAAQACPVEAECKPPHRSNPAPTAAKGQPTLAFPTVLKRPSRGMVIEVPVEVELARGHGGD
jgi:hypothetical protein